MSAPAEEGCAAKTEAELETCWGEPSEDKWKGRGGRSLQSGTVFSSLLVEKQVRLTFQLSHDRRRTWRGMELEVLIMGCVSLVR